jgi:hypothetical protein
MRLEVLRFALKPKPTPGPEPEPEPERYQAYKRAVASAQLAVFILIQAQW